MAHESDPPPTRVWWDDSEVEFIRWSEKSLVFSWGSTAETAVHLPRGAVVRLLRKGVLRVEGSQPDWASVHPEPVAPSDPAYRPMIHQPSHPLTHFEPITLDLPTMPVELVPVTGAESPVVKPQVDPPAGRLSAIARLIRKLGGSGRSG